mmetsp:Transcript_41268/g.81407  ORF Transcript_41268/g.81407 Transcript_41268/m.81407 type:complete len:81 (-) Transcript_41268:705-947(-)
MLFSLSLLQPTRWEKLSVQVPRMHRHTCRQIGRKTKLSLAEFPAVFTLSWVHCFALACQLTHTFALTHSLAYSFSPCPTS